MNMWTAKNGCKRLFRDSNAVQKRSPPGLYTGWNLLKTRQRIGSKPFREGSNPFVLDLKKIPTNRSLTHAGTTDLFPKKKDLRIHTSSRKELSHKKRDLPNGQGSNHRSLSGNGYRVFCSRRPESRASASGIRALKISAAPYGYGEDFKPDH